MNEDLIKKYKGDYGNRLGEIVYHLTSEWVELSVRWRAYENLFGHGPERVKLLNETIPGFANMLQSVLFDDCILSVCRLTDSPASMGKKNLTLNSLTEFADDGPTRNKLKELIKNAEQSVDFQRDWRNRKIGHNDLGLKLRNASPLKAATRDKMNFSIRRIHEVLEFLSLEYKESNLSFEVISPLGEETTLLHYLYLGKQTDQDEFKKLVSGEISARKPFPNWLS